MSRGTSCPIGSCSSVVSTSASVQSAAAATARTRSSSDASVWHSRLNTYPEKPAWFSGRHASSQNEWQPWYCSSSRVESTSERASSSLASSASARRAVSRASKSVTFW